MSNSILRSLGVILLSHLLIMTCLAEAFKNQEPVNVEIDAFSNSMTLKKSLMISNPIEAVAQITDVKSSCGCTAISFSKTPVQPGKKLPIIVTLDASSKVSSYSSDLLITWNNQLTTKLTINVALVNVLSISPQVLQIHSNIKESKKVMINLQNANIDLSSLTVLVVTDDDQDLSSKVIPLGKSGWSIDLRTMRSPKDELGFVKVMVKKSNSEFQTRYFICKLND